MSVICLFLPRRGGHFITAYRRRLNKEQQPDAPDWPMNPTEQDEYVLNQCTKYLNRSGSPPAPGDEAAAAAFRSRIAEAWRFPVIGLIREASADPDGDAVNLVSFVWK